MAKREFFVETNRNFKVSHQTLIIDEINFFKKTILGYTVLEIVPQVPDLSTIRINCQQCKILSIHIQDYKCDFTYSDPSQDIMASADKKAFKRIDYFSNAYNDVVKSMDSDLGNGELVIKVPELSDIRSRIRDNKVLNISIAFALIDPTAGVYFAVNNNDNEVTSNDQRELFKDQFMPHMYTYGGINSSRLWFPCIDSFSETCTWSIVVNCDDLFEVICSGELVEKEHFAKKKRKRFKYTMMVPTSAPNIGLVCGRFVSVVNNDMNEVTHWSFPTLVDLLNETCSPTNRIFEYYEDLLSSRYPYGTYKQVFVDNMINKNESYATLSILSINLLHSKRVIEQVYETRKTLARAIAEQYFGCFITMHHTSDGWLSRGISEFLALDYFRHAFGNNEYRWIVKRTMKKVIKYEEEFRPVVLDPSQKTYKEKDYFHVKHFQTFSPLYDKMHKRKSFLVMRMLENYLGRVLLLQVFNKMLSLALNAAPQPFSAGSWYNLHVSTNSFIWAISTVTGKNIDTFLKQWVFQGGHVKITGSFVFNRKRNTVEFEMRQQHLNQPGVWRYLGPIMIWLQELDGTFKHNFQIEDSVSKVDMTCHSKSRKNKKKKIPLCTGEEIDMDLSGMDNESPVLWVRIDPEMNLFREIILEQPDFQWQYQLRYEKDVIAQFESLEVLDKHFQHPVTKQALIEILENDSVFYRVRCEATRCLRDVANKMGQSWAGMPAMMTQFKKFYGSHSCAHIVKMNDFTNLKMYFLQKAMITSMAGLRTVHGICPIDVLRFLFDLCKYNDNSHNQYTDAYLKAALVDALSKTVTTAATIAPKVFTNEQTSTLDVLSADTKKIIEEIVRCFNIDSVLSSYQNVITVSCLQAIRHLQKMGHLPSSPEIFRHHTSSYCYIKVRKVAIEIMVDIVQAECNPEDLDFLFNLIVNDPKPVIKLFVLKELIKNPPFRYSSAEMNALDTEEFLNKMWSLMNGNFSADSKIRCALVDLFYVLYGKLRPRCLPRQEISFVMNMKDRKANSPLTPATGKSQDNSGASTTTLTTSSLASSVVASNVSNVAASSPSVSLFDKIFNKKGDSGSYTQSQPSQSLSLSLFLSQEIKSQNSTMDSANFDSFKATTSTSASVSMQVEGESSPDSGEEGEILSPKRDTPLTLNLSTVPSIRIKDPTDNKRLDDSSMTSSSPPRKKAKEDKEHKDKKHKDKKKKKKHKHKKQHKHKHGDEAKGDE